MARLVQQLTEAKIRTLTKIGLHPDGAGLYLQIRPGGARSWIYRFRLNGKTRDMGLGAVADVGLVRAREKAGAARALVDDGIDPIEHTRAQAIIPAAPKRRSSPTFEEVAESCMADRLKRKTFLPSWPSSARLARSLGSATSYCLVAESAAEVIGLISAELVFYFPTDSTICRITSLVVSSQHRGHGLGQKLLTAAIHFAREHNCSGLELTSADERVDAHRFYRRLGFSRTSFRFFQTV